MLSDASAPSASPVPPSFAEHCRLTRVRQDVLLDYLALAVICSGLLRSWPILAASDVAFLLAYAAATLGMLSWRRRHPASFAAWRQLPAVLMRVAVAASPTAWIITRQSLNAAAPYGDSRLWNTAAYCLLLAFCSFGCTGSILALARPVCLKLHVPAQILTLCFIWRNNEPICSTAVLQHPAAQEATRNLYSLLTALLGLLAVPPMPAGLRHGPMGQCRAVLTLAEFALGFLAPTLVLAASESRAYVQYQQHWLSWQQEQRLCQQQKDEEEQQQQRAEAPAASATASAAGASGSQPQELPPHAAPLPPPPPSPPAAAPHPQHSDQQAGSVLPADEDLDTALHPFLKPPSRAAASLYRVLQEPADVALTWLMAVLVLCSSFYIISMLTPL